MRLTGYSHSDIWDDIIPSKVQLYKKQNEISYWLSRKNSKLIQDIEFELYNEKWEVEN